MVLCPLILILKVSIPYLALCLLYIQMYIGAITVINEHINALEKEFDRLKKEAIKLLDASSVEVKEVVYELSTLPATEMSEHKVFLEEKSDKLEESKNHTALFRGLNFYWTYLSPHLLKHLVHQLPALKEIQKEMESYMTRLQEFRTQTPLELFCRVDKERIKPPEGFRAVVATFKQVKSKKFKSNTITLQDIEEFRLEYGKHYQLRDLALMLLPEVQRNCFIVTFLVPVSVVELLHSNIPKVLFASFGVTKLEVSGNCIFNDNDQPNISAMHSREPLIETGTIQDPHFLEITPTPITQSTPFPSFKQLPLVSAPGKCRSISLCDAVLDSS